MATAAVRVARAAPLTRRLAASKSTVRPSCLARNSRNIVGTPRAGPRAAVRVLSASAADGSAQVIQRMRYPLYAVGFSHMGFTTRCPSFRSVVPQPSPEDARLERQNYEWQIYEAIGGVDTQCEPSFREVYGIITDSYDVANVIRQALVK
jgi:hypothetical protein